MNLGNNPGDLLKRAVAAVRSEPVDPATIEGAARRVWDRISQAPAAPALETIRDCGDFRALLPEWLAGRLSESRALLVEDHTRECPACRRALWEARNRSTTPMRAARPHTAWRRPPRWAMARPSTMIGESAVKNCG